MTTRSIEHQTKVPEIRKGDTVLVLSGRDAGKRGKVEHVVRRDPSPTPVRSGYRRTSLKGGIYVVVEGLNISRKHTKPRQRSAARTSAPNMSLSTGFSPKPFGMILSRRRSSTKRRSRRFVVRVERRCVTGSLRWAMQASKSSSKQATALGSSVP